MPDLLLANPSIMGDSGCTKRKLHQQVTTALRSRPDVMRRSLQKKHTQWNQYWYGGAFKEQLWKVYGNNRQGRAAFFASYVLNDDDRQELWEAGVAAFVRLERRLLRNAYLDHYRRAGDAAVDSLVHAISTSPSLVPPEADFVLVSIDFEGAIEQGGVSEMGVSVLDTRRLLNSGFQEPVFDSYNFIVGTKCKTKRLRRFMFGDSLVTATANQLPETLSSICDVPDDQNLAPRKVILVGHGVRGDISVLESLGMGLESLPSVVGILDTGYLARDIVGVVDGLLVLLKWMEVPYRPGSLHCGGNDAHYTMRALLALLQRRYLTTASPAQRNMSISHRLGEIARAALPMVSEVERPVYAYEDEGLWFDELSEL